MDIPAGMLLEPPNLPGWENLPIRDRLAERLGFRYLDTGAMYRALTWLAISRSVPLAQGDRLGELAEEHPVQLDAQRRGWIADTDVTEMPDAAVRMFSKAKTGDITAFDLAVIGLVIVLVVAVIIFFERGQRRIPVQYAKRVVGRKIVGGQSSHLPLKVNTAGVIPPIFASSILMFPQQIASFVQTPWMQRISEALHPGDWRYNLLYVGMIVFFCYFYTAVTFNPVDVADNMKKYGGFIPGIRPGRPTAEYLNYVLTRLTAPGSLYLAVIGLIPAVAFALMGVSNQIPFGGTSLLIMVGVGLDTVKQIESQLQQRNYEGFLR